MKRTMALLSLYAVTMALLEAAVVVYARRLYYPENPLELFPLRFLEVYDPVLELGREAATILMILAVALLAEKRSLTRSFAAFVFVFGLWDLFYYAWLKLLIGWPRTWGEWDVLFLIPMVWLGPWICPAMIALLFVLWGAWGLVTTRKLRFTRVGLGLFVIGASLGLFTFMQPAIAYGSEALSSFRPTTFWWWLYGVSFVLMAIGLASTLSQPAGRAANQGVL